jgi:hypothetical protein
MEYVRPSILKRAVRPRSEKNDETADREFQREQARLHVLREQYRQREYDRLRALYGSSKDKAEIQAEVRAQMEALLAEKDALARLEQEEEQRLAAEMIDQSRFAEFVEQEQESARAEYERYLYEENVEMARQRRLLEQHDRSAVLEVERQRPDFVDEAFCKSFR